MPVLTITSQTVLDLCRLSTGDAQASADVTGAISRGQLAYESELSPDALADVALRPVLVLGVSQLLAADVLDVRDREPGAGVSVQTAGITLGKPLPHADRLREIARQLLAPYRADLGRVASSGAPVTSAEIIGGWFGGVDYSTGESYAGRGW